MPHPCRPGDMNATSMLLAKAKAVCVLGVAAAGGTVVAGGVAVDDGGGWGGVAVACGGQRVGLRLGAGLRWRRAESPGDSEADRCGRTRNGNKIRLFFLECV